VVLSKHQPAVPNAALTFMQDMARVYTARDGMKRLKYKGIKVMQQLLYSLDSNLIENF
jgi:hypothetical protein